MLAAARVLSAKVEVDRIMRLRSIAIDVIQTPSSILNINVALEHLLKIGVEWRRRLLPKFGLLYPPVRPT